MTSDVQGVSSLRESAFETARPLSEARKSMIHTCEVNVAGRRARVFVGGNQIFAISEDFLFRFVFSGCSRNVTNKRTIKPIITISVSKKQAAGVRLQTVVNQSKNIDYLYPCEMRANKVKKISQPGSVKNSRKNVARKSEEIQRLLSSVN